MAKKISKNATNLLKRDIKAKVYYNGEDGEYFTVIKVISLTDMINFVNEVSESVVDMETYSYDPAYLEFAMRQAVVEYYSDIKLPEDVSERYVFLYQTEIYNMVRGAINNDQYYDICAAIENKIDNMKEVINSHMFREVNKILSTFEEMTEAFSALSKTVKPEDLASLLSQLSEIGEIDERTVTNALIEKHEAVKAVEDNGK